jgi:hypothetical protein
MYVSFNQRNRVLDEASSIEGTPSPWYASTAAVVLTRNSSWMKI